MNTKALLAEFIGTFALVFVGAGAAAVSGGNLVMVALAFGFILAGLIYAYGSISGAHFNPAVTLAVALRGRIEWVEAVSYWVAQFAGAALAGAALSFVLDGSFGSLGETVVSGGITPLQAVLVEALLTFLLANAVLHTAARKASTEFAGLAIGFTLAACVLVGGQLTGASLNPARTFGPAIFTGTLDQFWIYLVGPAVGAAAAAGIYSLLNKK